MTVGALDLSAAGAWRYWLRNAAVFRRTWILGLTAWFIEPVVYLLAMGAGLGRYLKSVQGIDYVDFIAPGLLAVSAMYGASFEVGWNTFFKLERGRVYDGVVATPVSLEDVALGETVWAATRATMYGGAFAVIATPFGVFKSWLGLLTLPALGLVGLVFAVIGLIYTYLARRIDYLAYYWTLFITPMFLFAGVFFPLDRLPAWLRTVAWFMPLHHATNLMRALMLRGDLGAAAGAALWLAVVAVALIWVPPILLRRRLVP